MKAVIACCRQKHFFEAGLCVKIIDTNFCSWDQSSVPQLVDETGQFVECSAVVYGRTVQADNRRRRNRNITAINSSEGEERGLEGGERYWCTVLAVGSSTSTKLISISPAIVPTTPPISLCSEVGTVGLYCFTTESSDSVPSAHRNIILMFFSQFHEIRRNNRNPPHQIGTIYRIYDVDRRTQSSLDHTNCARARGRALAIRPRRSIETLCYDVFFFSSLLLRVAKIFLRAAETINLEGLGNQLSWRVCLPGSNARSSCGGIRRVQLMMSYLLYRCHLGPRLCTNCLISLPSSD